MHHPFGKQMCAWLMPSDLLVFASPTFVMVHFGLCEMGTGCCLASGALAAAATDIEIAFVLQ